MRLFILILCLLYSGLVHAQKSGDLLFTDFINKPHKDSADYISFSDLIANNHDAALGELFQSYCYSIIDKHSPELYFIIKYYWPDKKRLDGFCDLICDHYYGGGFEKYTRTAIKDKLKVLLHFSNHNLYIDERKCRYIEDYVIKCYFN